MVTLYCTYLCYSSLQSEPHDYQCNGLGKRLTAASGSTLAIGMVITIVSVVYSALRAGSNTQTFSRGVQGASEQPLVGVDEEEGLTSAGLDGEPEAQRMSELGLLIGFPKGRWRASVGNWKGAMMTFRFVCCGLSGWACDAAVRRIPGAPGIFKSCLLYPGG